MMPEIPVGVGVVVVVVVGEGAFPLWEESVRGGVVRKHDDKAADADLTYLVKRPLCTLWQPQREKKKAKFPGVGW